MKKLLIIIFLFAGTSMVYSQSNAIKVNIFSLAVKTFNVSFEHALNESSSLQLGFFYTGYSAGDTKFSGFGITPEYRFYLSDTDAPNGFYAAPFVRYQSFTLEEEIANSKGTFTGIGGGVIMGKHWIFKERVSLDIFLGPQYISGSVDVDSGSEDDFDVNVFSGFGIRAGLTFGLAF